MELGYSASYVNKSINACIHWLAYLGYEVVDIKRVPEHYDSATVEFLEKHQIRAIFKAIDSMEDEHLVYRNRAIIASSLYVGARRSEVTRLTVDDINISRGYVRFRAPNTKNKMSDTVYMNDEAKEIFSDWLYYRQGHRYYKGKSILFLNHRGEELTPDGLTRFYQDLSQVVGFRVTPTLLRHTLGTWMYLNGADILDIKQHMRHRNINSTLKYVNTANKYRLQRRVNQYLAFV
jgi:site-specific recombinase XerD